MWETATLSIVCFYLVRGRLAANNNVLMGLLSLSLFMLYMTSCRFFRVERRMAVCGFVTIALAITALLCFPVFAE